MIGIRMEESHVASLVNLVNVFWMHSWEFSFYIFGAAIMFGITKVTLMGLSCGADIYIKN